MWRGYTTRQLLGVWTAALLLAIWVAALPALGAVVAYKEIAPGVNAQVTDGHLLHLYCRIPKGAAAQTFLAGYLADPKGWTIYSKVSLAAIPFEKLNGQTQRRILEAIWPKDYVDAAGWWHTVEFEGAEGTETWEALTRWLAGSSSKSVTVRSAPQNQGLNGTLSRGQRVFFPMSLLQPAMRALSERPEVARPVEPLNGVSKELAYGSDADGEYAIYKIKPGEAIYTSVVARFTDFNENKDVLAASKEILARSKIANANRIRPGQEVRIPLDMLSARYRPAGSEQREDYESVREEAVRLQAQRVPARDLEGVVIVLDPGHGGRDYGAHHLASGLYEDELNYDIVCRIKQLLETTTRARVYVTVKDLSQGFEPTNKHRFIHDKDEVLLTTPNYPNEEDAKISANLRFYLANAIYRRERAKGTPDSRMLFATIHCDALYPKLRGTMVYVPGAQYRHTEYTPPGAIYARYDESKNTTPMRISASTFRRDEALSQNFAATLVNALRTYRVPIKVHNAGDPIRNAIRKSGGRAYNIAVLNYTLIPTKVLVETANLNNSVDRQRLADPNWRQWYAEAFVEAVKKHFASYAEVTAAR